MAFCAFCGKEISDRAPVCPNCGHPQGPVAGAPVLGSRTEGNAIASLVLGIASFFVCPVVMGILAVIFGKKAKENLARDPSLEGESLAKVGVILGWVNIALIGGMIALFVLIGVLSAAFGT